MGTVLPEVDYIRIVCADIHKSARFYRLLGLDFPDTPGVHRLDAAANGIRIVLYELQQMKRMDVEWVEPVGQRIAIAFRCASPNAVDAAFASIVHSGFRSKDVAPYDAKWGERVASVFDPDGNAVDLFAVL